MPFLRGKAYCYKKTKKGFGLINRTMDTKNRARAVHFEKMLDRLYDSAHHDLFRAWYEKRVDLPTLESHVLDGRHRELREALSRPDTVTLREAGEAAMEARGRTNHRRRKIPKPVTIQGYRASWRHFMDFMGEDTPCNEAIAVENIEDFVDSRLADRIAEQTINNDLNGISIVSGFAVEQRWIDVTPVFRRYEHDTRVNYLTPVQWDAYLAELHPDSRVQMMFLFGTGARLGESERLRLGAIHMDSVEEARCTIVTGKTKASTRDIFIPAWVARALIEHVHRLGLSGDDLVFTIPRRTVQKEHRRAVEDSGIVTPYRYTIHDHRHSAAVAWAQDSLEVDKIQRQLGHKSITTTMKYTAYDPHYSDVGPTFDKVARKFRMDGTAVAGDNSGDTVTPPLAIAGGE